MVLYSIIITTSREDRACVLQDELFTNWVNKSVKVAPASSIQKIPTAMSLVAVAATELSQLVSCTILRMTSCGSSAIGWRPSRQWQGRVWQIFTCCPGKETANGMSCHVLKCDNLPQLTGSAWNRQNAMNSHVLTEMPYLLSAGETMLWELS